MINAKEQEEVKKALVDGSLLEAKEKFRESLLVAYSSGWKKFGRDHGLEADQGLVSADIVVDRLSREHLGQLQNLYSSVADEAILELKEVLSAGESIDVFQKALREKMEAKLQGEYIQVGGLHTTVDNYVDIIVRTGVRKARDAGNTAAMLSTGLVDEEHCIVVSTLSENTCDLCRARHGKVIKMSDNILLHPRCQCTRRPIFKEETGIKQLGVQGGLTDYVSDIFAEDWRLKQQEANLYG